MGEPVLNIENTRFPKKSNHLNRGIKPMASLQAALPTAAIVARDTSILDRPPASASTKQALRKGLLAGAGLLGLVAAAWFGAQYWTVGRFQVSTDDAYVQADN